MRTTTQPIASDRRYSVKPEWCGDSVQRYVARFCGEWIGSNRSYPAAVLLCVGHKNVRNGAEVVIEKA